MRARRWLSAALVFLAMLVMGDARAEADREAQVDAALQALTGTESDLQTLKLEVERLKKLVVQLQTENQQLRRLLAEPRAVNMGESQVPPTPSRSAVSSALAGQETGCWLTASSNKRHNSTCRYFKATKGRSCGPDEGIPCKICGG
jgi:hypothetical protein